MSPVSTTLKVQEKKFFILHLQVFCKFEGKKKGSREKKWYSFLPGKQMSRSKKESKRNYLGRGKNGGEHLQIFLDGRVYWVIIHLKRPVSLGSNVLDQAEGGEVRWGACLILLLRFLF